MSLLVTLNGANYIIPQTNEVGWGSNLDDYFVAIPAGVLQKTGGSFTLSAETDFGASFGLKSLSYKSRSSNIAATGILRLANNSDAVSWRNAGNSADLALTVNASNQLCFNGTPIESNALTSAHILVGNSSNVATDVAMSGNIGIDNTGATTIQAGVIVNSMVNASAAIAYSKLSLTGSIVNADVNAAAAIAYSKLNLALSVVNADVSTSAAIAYSKLNLSGSIVNADVNASAAIAYSKLALTGSIVNADISSSAAIAITKIAIGTANQIIGTNNGATANEFKTLTATANQVSVTHGAGTVTFATPQDIGTASAVRFGSLALGAALDASSILSLSSTSKGFLPPVMTTTQKNAISTPTDGLIVYDSSLAQLFLRASGSWTNLSVGGGSGTVASGTQYQLGYYAAGGTTLSGLTLITGSRALASDANGLPVAATTTATELGYVNGVTSAIQTQINTKAPTASPTFTGVASFADGVVGSPSITFTSDPDTGIYSRAANSIAITQGGSAGLVVNSTGTTIKGAQLNVQDGVVGTPSYTFENDLDTGLYRLGANSFGLAVGGSLAFSINSDLTTFFQAGTTVAGNLKFNATSTQGIVGTTTNDSAAAGNVGEVVTTGAVQASAPTSGQYGDLGSITLTAGNWVITAQGEQSSAPTSTVAGIGISTTAGNDGTGLTGGDNFMASLHSSGFGGAYTVAGYRVSISTSTTYYLKMRAIWSGGTAANNTFFGRMSAIRVR